jgi:hypothetical protein
LIGSTISAAGATASASSSGATSTAASATTTAAAVVSTAAAATATTRLPAAVTSAASLLLSHVFTNLNQKPVVTRQATNVSPSLPHFPKLAAKPPLTAIHSLS